MNDEEMFPESEYLNEPTPVMHACPIRLVTTDNLVFVVPDAEAWTYTPFGIWAEGYWHEDEDKTVFHIEFYEKTIKFVTYDLSRMHEAYASQLREQLEQHGSE